MHTRFTKWDKLIILFVVDKQMLVDSLFYQETKELIINNNHCTLSLSVSDGNSLDCKITPSPVVVV